jgi:7 transmembrane helices usually fused to an inactive transglutaminase/Inactive transglutaminase fused to 7 transmembrane helices
MSSKTRFALALFLLCFTGIGIALHKNHEIGIPLWMDQKPSTWLIEAKATFYSPEGKPAIVELALPQSLSTEAMGHEVGSSGFGFTRAESSLGTKAVWSLNQPKAKTPHSLYYRVRLPDQPTTGSAGVEVQGKSPVAESPGLTGAVEQAALALIQKSRDVSGDTNTFFNHLFLELASSDTAQEILLLRRHYEKEEKVTEENQIIVIGIDLLKMAGIPARLAHGIVLDADAGAQSAIPLIEYLDGATWRVKNPATPNATLRSDNIFVWNRGGSSLLDVFGGENSRVVFTVLKEVISLEKLNQLSKSPFLTSTILSLPASEREVFRFVLLIPLGAFVVVLLRNIVGIPTLGTFMPVLLALGFLEMPLGMGVAMFVTIVAVGLFFRFLLSSMNLLVVPRVAACVVIVTLLMVFMSLISWKLGFNGVLQITLFPMIIIAWTIERMSLIWEEEGKRNAIIQVGGSVVVAVIAYLFMKVPQIQYWAHYFPELLLVLLAAILLIGRYTGYRLSELHRFRNFTEA